MKKIVFLLPTYNEVDNIKYCVEGVLKQQKKIKGWRIEILIVDGGSTDGTIEKAKQIKLRDPRVHFLKVERGLGVALIKGHAFSIKHFNPHVLAQIDSDGQIEPNSIPKLIKSIENGYTLVLGSRFIKGGKNQIAFMGRLFSLCSSLLCKLVMGPLDINEFNTLTRAFTPELFKRIDLNRLPWREQTFIIQPAFLIEAIRAGAKYKEIPIVCKKRLRNYSKNKVISYTLDVILYALNIRFEKWRVPVKLFNFKGDKN